MMQHRQVTVNGPLAARSTAASRDPQCNVVAHPLNPHCVSPQNRVGQEQANGRFAALAICRSRLGVAGSGDLCEFVLTQHDGPHDFAVRASLAQQCLIW
jgi:hypothetical protein